ncbi:PH domain-containing protein [Streptomyces sp. NPDC005648]|uniref:PH domain-containing protein n=1 Tax=Streptomyces sp. NPDC005648 TaxID=3157044 RepID=UPI0033AA2584
MSTLESKDRVYRSPAGIAGGALLLAITAWLGLDAIFSGHGRTPWLALATMILVVPLIIAFTIRPAVYADEERLRVRNPFRVIVVPWSEAVSLRSSYSNELVVKSGTKYQLWALPVSLRGRKRAARREARMAADRAAEASGRPRRGGGLGGFGMGGGLGGGLSRGAADQDGPVRPESDRAMDELRELLEARGGAENGWGEAAESARGEAEAESARGEVTVRWAYEVVGPALAGAVLLAILLATG